MSLLGSPPILGTVVRVTSSHGAMNIGLYDHDCPFTVQLFSQMIRCGYYVGSQCTEVVKNNYLRFSPYLVQNAKVAAECEGRNEPSFAAASGEVLDSLLLNSVSNHQVRRNGANQLIFPRSEFTNITRGIHVLALSKKEKHSSTTFVTNKQLVNRPGLILFDTSTTEILITISRQNLFFLVETMVGDGGLSSSSVPRYVLLGEVTEGLNEVVQRKFSQAALREVSSNTGGGKLLLPCRLIRLKDTTVTSTCTTLSGSSASSSQDNNKNVSKLYCDVVEKLLVLRQQMSVSSCGVKKVSPIVVVKLRLRRQNGQNGQVEYSDCVKHVLWNPEFGGRHIEEDNDHDNGGKKNSTSRAETTILSSDDEEDDIYSKLLAQRQQLGGRGMLKSTQQDLEKQLEQVRQRKAAKDQERSDRTRALMLQVADGLPTGDDGGESIVPPENVLFVCKLNPLTTSEGLATCFTSFGQIRSCEVMRDKNTNASLQYAFIEFESAEACERAFEKMDRVLIDDSRIHVDFSQSVSKLYFEKRTKTKNAAKKTTLSSASNGVHVPPQAPTTRNNNMSVAASQPSEAEAFSPFHQSGYKRPRDDEEDYY